eukprot:TRINITY_DN36550_c0_g1_i1.p1 TRINITY_DN36550_c0_g1~~TRINITY_DN36550_c0_g1_i1.p1  ORF type:complete len:1430 (-),score=297.95 TRINITY_DN36550_c0_g1_i1:137-3961(-)
MVAASGLACIIMGRQGRIMGLMEEAQLKQDRRGFRFLLLQYPLCCAAAAAFVSVADFLRSHLALEWRRIATARLHDLYFSRMNYYKLLHDHARGAQPDADARICDDLAKVTASQAALLHSMASSATMSLIFSVQIKATVGSWRVAMVSPAVVFFLLPLVAQGLPALLTRLDLSWAQAKHKEAMAAYRNALSRLQVHGERILMLQGCKYELDELDGQLQDVIYWDEVAEQSTSHQEGCAGIVFSPNGAMGMGAGLCLLFPSIHGAHEALREGRLGPKPLDPYEFSWSSLEDCSKYTQSFTYSIFALKSWAGCLTALMKSQSIAGARHRVLSLYQRLLDLESEQQDSTIKDSGEGCISFQGVGIQTPTGQRLLEKVTFDVRQGESMLISGHNGAGKSSIVRCLCNLWPIPSGTVCRPGWCKSDESDDTIHRQIFYLPQKAVSVIGSLSDQLTYPIRVPEGLEETELRRWLSYVDLEYLVDQAVSMWARSSEAVDWAQVLSAGEQQALGIARLLYHRPRFAILDECTSAVSRTLERRLYDLTRVLGMSVISIAHRPALEELHGRMLCLTGRMADDGRGWALQDLPGRRELEAQMPSWCEGAEEAHCRITAFLAASNVEPEGEPEIEKAGASESDSTELSKQPQPRHVPLQAPSSAGFEKLVRQRWPSSFSRVREVLRLAISKPGDGRKVAWHCAVTAALLAGRVKVMWELWKALGGVLRGGLCGNMKLICTETLSYALLQPLLAFLDHAMRRAIRRLLRSLGGGACLELHRRALAAGSGGAFTRTSQPLGSAGECLPDPLDRITELHDALPELCQQLEFALPQIALGASALPLLVGGFWDSPRSLAALPAFFGIFCLVSRAVAPDWTAITKELKRKEANFQAMHTRFRRIAEPVAFNGGGTRERGTVEPALQQLLTSHKASLKDEFLHAWATLMLTNFDFLPQLLTRMLNYDFALRNNPDPSLGLAPETYYVTLLYGRVIDFVRDAIMCLPLAVRAWKHADASLLGALELVEALRLAEEEQSSTSITFETSHNEVALEVRGLELQVPLQQRSVVSDLNFKLSSGKAVLVTGPSGSGKSLLTSSLLHWARTKASIGDTSALIGVAPQHIYLPPGTLGDQVCYPDRFSACLDQELDVSDERKKREADMLRALKTTGLAYLLGREEAGWYAERNWEEVLSGGEQQRLQLARLVYRRPRFAVLDDCTSMVAHDAEEGLYRTMSKKYDITPLTCTQRAFLSDSYSQELRFGLPGRGWALQARSSEVAAAEAKVPKEPKEVKV